jgi:hypothetical protein
VTCPLGQQVLDLGVDASQVVIGPPAQRVEQARVEPQQESLGWRHPRPQV